jgi:hypothetical protein
MFKFNRMVKATAYVENMLTSFLLPAEGPADERCYHRLNQCRAPLSPSQ